MNMEEYWVHASMQLVVLLTASREPRGFGFVQYVEPAHAAEAKYQMDKSMTNVSLFDSHDQSARLMELHVLDALYSVSREPKAPYAVSNGLNASVSVHHGPSVLSDCHKFNEFLSDSHEPKASFSAMLQKSLGGS